MRILWQNGSQRERRLYVPNALLANRLTAFWVSRGLESHGIHLPVEQIRMIAESIKAVRERHPAWVLLEAERPSGEKIRVIL